MDPGRQYIFGGLLEYKRSFNLRALKLLCDTWQRCGLSEGSGLGVCVAYNFIYKKLTRF